ncbi:MAG: nucleotidyltransferase family protein [Chloroflexi bacterium]|nr:nucleotidyltransferase family protein [Chloroflexota bacterium]
MYALIIAGGEGERLRPLTNDRPKPMIPVGGKPILQRQIEWLRGESVTNFVLLCGYRADVIQKHFGDGSRFNVSIDYSVEDEPLGRGGALRKGFALVPDAEGIVIATNGDILTDQPLAPVIQRHKRKHSTATVVLTALRSPYGVAKIARDNHIDSFEEKPILPHWINAGVYVLSREFFAMLPKKGDHETTTFPRLSNQGRLFGFKSKRYWRAIDSFKDLKEAERELADQTRVG